MHFCINLLCHLFVCWKPDVDANRANIPFSCRKLLLERNQHADNHCEEGNTFNQSGSDNHRGTDVATGFGLTGHTFHGALTDFTNADTGTNGGETGSHRCSQVTPSHACGSLQKNQ
jgi:hypothetical protein